MSAIMPPSPDKAEAEHLSALNDKIKSLASIAHPFKKEDLVLRGEKPEESSPTPLVETLKAVDVGGGFVQAVLKANFGTKPDGSPNLGQFTPLFMESKKWKETGALQIVEVSVSDELPVKKSERKNKKGNDKKLEQLNNEILAASSNSNGMTYRKLDIPDLVDYQLIDLNPGRFVVAKVTNTEGETFPVALNIKDASSGNEGAIFAARNPVNAEFHLAKQPKPVIGLKVIGPPQGFAVATDDPNSGLMKGLSDEFGLERVTRSIDLKMLEEDLNTCLVTDRFISLNLNINEVERLSRPELEQNMKVQLEKLAHERVSRAEAVEGLINDRFKGAHARTGIGLSLLSRGELILNPKVDGDERGLVLQIVRPRFDPKNARLTLPNGPVSLGISEGDLSKDPTKFRDNTPIMVVNKSDLTPADNVFHSYREIFKSMAEPSGFINTLGVIETAAIITHAVKNEILVPNF